MLVLASVQHALSVRSTLRPVYTIHYKLHADFVNRKSAGDVGYFVFLPIII